MPGHILHRDAETDPTVCGVERLSLIDSRRVNGTRTSVCQGATLVRLPRPFPFALCLQHAGCTSNFPSSNFLTPSCGRSRRETACPWQTARVCDDAVARGRVSSVLAPGLLRWTVCGLRYTLILVPPRGSRTIAYPDSATRHCAPGSSLPLGVLQLACVDDESFGHYLRYKNGSYIKQRRFSDRPA